MEGGAVDGAAEGQSLGAAMECGVTPEGATLRSGDGTPCDEEWGKEAIDGYIENGISFTIGQHFDAHNGLDRYPMIDVAGEAR
jgi:hypothetical protein